MKTDSCVYGSSNETDQCRSYSGEYSPSGDGESWQKFRRGVLLCWVPKGIKTPLPAMKRCQGVNRAEKDN